MVLVKSMILHLKSRHQALVKSQCLFCIFQTIWGLSLDSTLSGAARIQTQQNKMGSSFTEGNPSMARLQHLRQQDEDNRRSPLWGWARRYRQEPGAAQHRAGFLEERRKHRPSHHPLEIQSQGEASKSNVFFQPGGDGYFQSPCAIQLICGAQHHTLRSI